MPDKQKFRFEPANYIGLKFRQAIESVEIQFATQGNEPFAATIPLAQLGRMHRDILRKLETEPDLFALGSKKDQP